MHIDDVVDVQFGLQTRRSLLMTLKLCQLALVASTLFETAAKLYHEARKEVLVIVVPVFTPLSHLVH